ncbi:integrase [Acidilutibacter cellobiosedens]|uniref:Integrase n=1 Tax=Acidilutibacter cellobiosedens TaxID=2507161 RepID=A0A410QH33_9FIRM|nr:integrase [Tissierellaceae bacterium]QAT63383.1 integrase [Acidilutibacter cellobiosedens]
MISNYADQSLDYDEELVRLLVEKVNVFESNVVVRFKSGIEVEV